MSAKSPVVVVLAGPNGAGKSTTAPTLLKGTLGVTEFVNPDVIARGLSAFEPEHTAMAAGRIMLRRIRDMAGTRTNFAFETTLASRSFAPWLARLRSTGYRVHVLFLWLPSADMAVARVTDRVKMGGHHVPEDQVRRRYVAGLRNFFRLYQPLATTWRLYDNSGSPPPRLIARGRGSHVTKIVDSRIWAGIAREVLHENSKSQRH